jgi:transketolase
VLPPGVPVLSVEAGTITGWTKFAHAAIGMTTFGASGPLNVRAFDLVRGRLILQADSAQAVMKKFGFTADNVAEKAKLCVEFYRTNPVPVLLRKPWAHL